jgi:hypothetical protein
MRLPILCLNAISRLALLAIVGAGIVMGINYTHNPGPKRSW